MSENTGTVVRIEPGENTTVWLYLQRTSKEVTPMSVIQAIAGSYDEICVKADKSNNVAVGDVIEYEKYAINFSLFVKVT